MVARRVQLAQRRKTVGLSQERLAELVGVDRSTVVRWERAETEPQPWHRPKLAAALRISAEELAALLEDVGGPPAPARERLDYALKHPGRVDLVAVAYLREQVRRLDEQYETVPSTLILAAAGQLHGQATFLHEHAVEATTRRALTETMTESATLLGQLVWDASQRRDHGAAVHYFDQAIQLAQATGDAVAEANAQLRKSFIALYGTRRPAAGRALAARAAAVGEGSSNVMAGLAHLHVGEANAMLGDDHGCATALDAAERHLACVTAEDAAFPLYCASQLARIAGSCQLFLGKPAKAEPILHEARHLLSGRKKATAIVLGNLALAAIRQRQLDAAAARLHEAIGVLEQTRGGGGLNVVFGVARELQPWRNERSVQEVNDRLLALMASA